MFYLPARPLMTSLYGNSFKVCSETIRKIAYTNVCPFFLITSFLIFLFPLGYLFPSKVLGCNYKICIFLISYFGVDCTSMKSYLRNQRVWVSSPESLQSDSSTSPDEISSSPGSSHHRHRKHRKHKKKHGTEAKTNTTLEPSQHHAKSRGTREVNRDEDEMSSSPRRKHRHRHHRRRSPSPTSKKRSKHSRSHS